MCIRDSFDPDHPLLHTPNVILSPHVGFDTCEAMEKRAEIVMENLKAFLNGTPQKMCIRDRS